MKYYHFSSLVFAFMLFYSCDDASKDIDKNVPDGLVAKSLEIFEGNVIEKKLDEDDGIKTWEIEIRNANGSKVKFYWLVGSEALHRIDGQDGPFDYDINPGEKLINFSVAKTVAMGAVKIEDIVKWQINQDDNFASIWVYNFEFNKSKGATSVFINAKNGDILKID